MGFLPKLSEDFVASPSIKLFVSMLMSVLATLTLSTPAADLVVTSWSSSPSSVNVSQCPVLRWVWASQGSGGRAAGACAPARETLTPSQSVTTWPVELPRQPQRFSSRGGLL